ncbi:MAG: DedA family protein [Candidatus Bathyarchaeia archaeon]
MIRYLEPVMLDIWRWMDNIVATYGYIGFFLISIFGNITVIFPAPYTIIIYAGGVRLDPLLLGLACGLGAGIGELSAYLVGRGGRQLVEEKYGKRLESAKRLIQRYGALAIFIFAATPLPDDMLLIPLGLIKYDIKKALLACFLGKWLMCTLIAYAGKFSYDFILNLFKGSGLLGMVAGFVLLILMVVAVFKIDWTRFLEPKGERRSKDTKRGSEEK